MIANQERIIGSDPSKSGKNSVKKILLVGVFWRILFIEAILLVASLLYRALTESPAAADLFWYAMRIIFLIGIIIAFMMVTLRSFLTRKIISPLEAIASSNRRLQIRDIDPNARNIELPKDTPVEIKEIVDTRTQMLTTLLKVSEERLRLVDFIRDTFGRYLSKKLVDEILETPEGQKIGGRTETVTILLSDLRGFTGLSETRGPEEMVELLNRYLERMSKVILAYDGIIDEFIGDAILAVFGVPEKREDDAERAVACGLAMQNALMELNEEIVSKGYPPLEMGIGINTGTVIVGNIGSELRTKYGIVGFPVNEAARIESNTTGGQVLIGESTYKLVKALVKADSPQTVMMKGLKKPLVSYPVSEIGPPYDVKSSFQVDTESGVEISLPFHCWKVDDKKIASEAINGETMRMNESVITASVDPPFRPLTNIKLIFDFCVDAHCFDDIYAKVVSVEEHKGKTVNNLRITSINQKDRDILNKWMEDAV
ncbi:MAG: adenylate/guanylate cyclase domain-containing protein [Desulfobacteraceae bacterium]|jgi:class 3 adenylate cyclase